MIWVMWMVCALFFCFTNVINQASDETLEQNRKDAYEKGFTAFIKVWVSPDSDGITLNVDHKDGPVWAGPDWQVAKECRRVKLELMKLPTEEEIWDKRVFEDPKWVRTHVEPQYRKENIHKLSTRSRFFYKDRPRLTEQAAQLVEEALEVLDKKKPVEAKKTLNGARILSQDRVDKIFKDKASNPLFLAPRGTGS